MFQLSLFTEFGRLCNPFDYVLGFTFLLMAFHLLFLLFNLRERQRVKLFCLGSASLVLLLHIAALRLSFQFTNLTFDTVATGRRRACWGRWAAVPGCIHSSSTCFCCLWRASRPGKTVPRTTPVSARRWTHD